MVANKTLNTQPMRAEVYVCMPPVKHKLKHSQMCLFTR